MKKLYPTLLMVSLSLIATLPNTAQIVTFDWAYKIGGVDQDYGQGITADAHGNVYVIGRFGQNGNIDFDPGTGVVNLTDGGLFIQKVDANRNLLWAKQIKYAYVANGSHPVVDGSGNVYFAGSFDGTQDFDPGAGVFNLSTDTVLGSPYDIFIEKLDSNGNFVWAKDIGTRVGRDAVNDITMDKTGNLIISGEHEYLTDFDPGAGTYFLDGTQSGREFLLKINRNGDFIWAKNFAYRDIHTYTVTTDNNGNIFTSGWNSMTIDMDPGPDTAFLYVNNIFNRHAFIQKLDSNGNFLWAKGIGSTKIEGYQCTVDDDGNVYLTGDYGYYSQEDFDPGPGTVYLQTTTCVNAFILKLDANGNYVWANAVSGTTSSHGLAMAIDGFGNIYSTGYYANGDFDPGPGSASLTSAGIFDAYIQKLDAAGNLLWVKSIGGPEHDAPRAIHVDPSGSVYVTGYFEETIDADPGTNVFSLTASDLGDVFVVKLSQEGVTAIKEELPLREMKLLPNPNTGLAVLELATTLSSHITLYVSDLAGRTLMAMEKNLVNGTNRIAINTSDFANGLYFVNVHNGTENNVVRMVVNK
jgi:hypothetical protein